MRGPRRGGEEEEGLNNLTEVILAGRENEEPRTYRKICCRHRLTFRTTVRLKYTCQPIPVPCLPSFLKKKAKAERKSKERKAATEERKKRKGKVMKEGEGERRKVVLFRLPDLIMTVVCSIPVIILGYLLPFLVDHREQEM
jgi:hypothetical protein